jgi:hypothetical protein
MIVDLRVCIGSGTVVVFERPSVVDLLDLVEGAERSGSTYVRPRAGEDDAVDAFLYSVSNHSKSISARKGAGSVISKENAEAAQTTAEERLPNAPVHC